MDQLALLVFGVVASLPPRFVLDEDGFLPALLSVTLDGPGDERPFAGLTASIVHDALVAAADAGLVREVEIDPGRFLVVRSETEAGPTPARVPQAIERLVRRLRSVQIDGGALERALLVPIETVALRRAILSPTLFVWPADDYAALLEAARQAPDAVR